MLMTCALGHEAGTSIQPTSSYQQISGERVDISGIDVGLDTSCIKEKVQAELEHEEAKACKVSADERA